MKLRVCFVIVSFLSAIVGSVACHKPPPTSELQLPHRCPASSSSPVLPRTTPASRSTGVVGIQFSLYRDQQAGAPLWMETQNIQADAAGYYTALVGAASADEYRSSCLAPAKLTGWEFRSRVNPNVRGFCWSASPMRSKRTRPKHSPAETSRISFSPMTRSRSPTLPTTAKLTRTDHALPLLLHPLDPQPSPVRTPPKSWA